MRPFSCPECSAILVSIGTGPPWCPHCEWGLDAVPVAGHGRSARGERKRAAAAYRLDRRVFAALSGDTVAGRPGLSPRLLVVAATAVVLGVLAAGLLALAVTMVVVASWPLKLVGLFLIGCVIELRPRLPGIGISPWIRTRSEEPDLFALIDAVATSIGAPSVDRVVLDEDFDASCARYGIRRRRVLVLGLPMWAALGAEGRIALLAHQLGHLVDRDPDQNLVAQPALTTFGILAESFGQRGRALPDVAVLGGKNGEVTSGEYAAMIGAIGPTRHSYESMAGGLSALLFLPLRWAFLSIHRALRALTAESRQRAEYYADALAVGAAGTAGMIEYCQTLLLRESVFTATRRWLRVGADIGLIQAEAAEVVQSHDDDRRHLEQRSIRTDSSLFASHPPVGWRLRMVRSWPVSDGTLSLLTFDFRSVDAQLAAEYRRVGRAMTHVA